MTLSKRIWILLLGLLFFCLTPPLQATNAQAEAEERVEDQQDMLTLDFEQVDLNVFIKFMSTVTGRNFLVDDQVKGRVTILSPSPISLDEAYAVFQSVLEVKGFTTIPSGDVTKIVPTVESRQKRTPTAFSNAARETGSDQIITQVIPLENISAEHLRKILVPMVSKQGLVVAFAPTETLILIDYESNVQRLLSIIRTLDVDAMEGTVSTFHLENGSAQEVLDKLSELMLSGSEGKKPLKGKDLRLVADERTNSIIFMATRDQSRQIKAILATLDQPTPENLRDIQVVALENAQAEDLAGVLSSLSGSGDEKKGGPVISKNISIVADKASNSLVIIADPKEFQTLKPIIEALDRARRQVYVEAAIVEVSTDTSLNLGVDWQGASDFGGGSSEGVVFGAVNGLVGSTVGEITDSIGSNPAGVSLGVLSLPFTFRGEEFFSLGAFIKASQNDNSIRIISTPQLMTMENEEASVIVAENRPFITSREESETGNDFTNFEYKDVGVTLKVTPLINDKGWIKLNLFQEVSRIDPNVEFTSQTPITRKRTVETTVRVKDSQTLVIAGLMEDKNAETESKAPGLGDIPGLGNLFKVSTQEDNKTNLMIFITPRLVASSQQARDLARSNLSLTAKKKQIT